MPRPIIVVDYDPEWPKVFAMLRDRIAAPLGDVAAAIEHVGSTAVPGLAAKPIIDIHVLLASAGGLQHAIERLAPLGYEHEGDLGVIGREAFKHAPDLPVHHLYVCLPDCAEYGRNIAFRDYLRAHSDSAQAYGALKIELAKRHRDDRKAYTAAKTDFVADIVRRAMTP